MAEMIIRGIVAAIALGFFAGANGCGSAGQTNSDSSSSLPLGDAAGDIVVSPTGGVDAAANVAQADSAGHSPSDDVPGEGGGSPTGSVDGAADASDSGHGAVVATISQTASTNTPSSQVVVYADGSAERTVGIVPGGRGVCYPDAGCTVLYTSEETTYFPSTSPAVAQFLLDLQSVGDVSKIAVYDLNSSYCSKSVSNGTKTFVSANGQTSGDLQCMKNPTAAQSAVYADCRGLL